MKIKNILISPLFICAVSFLLSSCDEGRIYPIDEADADYGAVVTLEGTVVGLDSWPEGYTVSLAGFAPAGEYASISKNIVIANEGNSNDGESNEIYTSLTNIPSGVATIEVCVLDRLRRRVATFKSIPFDASEAEIRLRVENLDIDMTTAVQNEIFSTTCANCHGGSGYAAANLNLTQGHSATSLIGVESMKRLGTLRVEPGNAAGSLLYDILTGNSSSEWNYDHSKEIYDRVKLDLIKNWINNL